MSPTISVNKMNKGNRFAVNRRLRKRSLNEERIDHDENTAMNQISEKESSKMAKIEKSLKRELVIDDEQTSKRQMRKRRKLSVDNSSLESTSSDDYGTDSEVIAINQKHCKNSLCRCASASFSVYDDDGDDGYEADSNDDSEVSDKFHHFVEINKLGKILYTRHYDSIMQKITSETTKISNSSTKCLFDLTISTIQLVKRNQELQMKIFELQSDTRKFIDSIMTNPENRLLKRHLESIKE